MRSLHYCRAGSILTTGLADQEADHIFLNLACCPYKAYVKFQELVKTCGSSPKILSLLDETQWCHHLGWGAQLWQGELQLGSYYRFLNVIQVYADPQWTRASGLQGSWQEAGETNNPVPSPAASYSKVGITIWNNRPAKVRQFSCLCQQTSILINPETTECKWSLCDRFSETPYFEATEG